MTAPDETTPAEGTPRSDKLALLEQEGEIAADYLEVLLDIADLDGDIDIDVEGDRATVALVGEELDVL
ncbi:MAG: spoIIIJ-associated protein, partial [Frankiaceae bacterium]|nr:spoIIIJ-associated protein [Frankiaceae bacterium]